MCEHVGEKVGPRKCSAKPMLVTRLVGTRETNATNIPEYGAGEKMLPFEFDIWRGRFHGSSVLSIMMLDFSIPLVARSTQPS